MARQRRQDPRPEPSDLDAALAAMDADELRNVVRDLLLELDDRAHSRVVGALIERVARGDADWMPESPSEAVASKIAAFAETAERAGYADPSDVDDHLQQGSNAFLSKDYAVAARIFRALLPPIGDGEIDLGQHEMVDEVLGTDVAACAAQYAVSVYMTSAPDERAGAVEKAIDEVRGVGHFWAPLREMERVAVEALPGLGDFLRQWRVRLQSSVQAERKSDWDTEPDRWLREVVERMEGADGLAQLARSTKRADDLRAWCRTLVQAKDWKAALVAHDEAAAIVADKDHARGEFLDAAALAAQELGRRDLPTRLERAWRESPSMLRLGRWLGSAKTRHTLRKRAAEALDACPGSAHRQRAFLHLLLGEHASAATLLSTAPGIGWSDKEHPGQLLVPLFRAALGGRNIAPLQKPAHRPTRALDLEALEWMSSDRDEPRLATPTVEEIVDLARIDEPPTADAQTAMLRALLQAAEKRLAGVTENKRRRYYGHAAELVAICQALDPTPSTGRWVSGVRSEYRRYPALQRELAHHLEQR
ncbi:MAG: hypothetical protein CL908_10935 [Deltaproteobacteria bacterium]|nr:hypothetical protein [Deltaproteobacteria bacterium]